MTFEDFVGIIRHNYYATRKNKRYGTDQMEFESDYTHRLLSFARELWSRTFRIPLNYAFLTSTPKWREIFATMFEGRMADHLLCDPLVPYMEKELSDRTYNNRKEKGSQAAINQLIEDIYNITEGYTKPARIIKYDLKGFFPSAKWDVIYECYENLIDKYKENLAATYGDEYPSFLKWLAMVCIYCRPTEHCVLRTPTHYWYRNITREKSIFAAELGNGAPIGRLSSQHGMGLYINDEIIWLNEDIGILTICFVDDITEVVPEELHEYALSHTKKLREKLAKKGIKINDHKFYDQPYEHGVEFLGSHIKPNRTHLNRKTIQRGITRIKEFSNTPGHLKYILLDSYIACVNSYTGLLKNRNDYKILHIFKNIALRHWGSMIEWNNRKLCLNCKVGYRFHDRLTRKYAGRKRNNKLNLEIYEQRRITDTAQRAVHRETEPRSSALQQRLQKC